MGHMQEQFCSKCGLTHPIDWDCTSQLMTLDISGQVCYYPVYMDIDRPLTRLDHWLASLYEPREH
jgi:hypothetical protein